MEEGIVRDSNSSNPTSSRNMYNREKERFKQVAGILVKLFMLLIAFGTVKTSDAGQKLVTEALVIAVVVFFLVLLLHAMLHDHVSGFFAILFILVLATVVSVLALSLVSWTAAIIALTLWVVTITAVVIFNFQELCKLILSAVLERIKKLIENYTPQFGVPRIIQKWITIYRPQRPLLPVGSV